MCRKNVHLWFATTLTYVNAFWYFLAEMLPIKQAIKRRFTVLPQVTCASALPGKTGKHENRMLYQCIARIQPVAPWFSQSVRLTTHTHAAVWFPKPCDQCIQLRLLEGSWFRRKAVEGAAAVGLCCTHNASAPNALSSWKKNFICDVFDSVWH